MKDKRIIEIYRELYDGIGRTRTHKSASSLKEFIEMKMTFVPVLWMGFGFSKSKGQGAAWNCLDEYFRRILPVVNGHHYPLVAWNADDPYNKSNGKVRNDIHCILMLERENFDCGVYGKVKQLETKWTWGRKPDIQRYDLLEERNAIVFYQTLRHNEIAFMTYCRNRKRACKGKGGRKGKNDCEFRREPLKLLR